jgi:siroheme synthase-like protein
VTAYYPVSLNVEGRACLVVGGGPVAARKALGLLGCGAIVTVIAPDICPAMAELGPLHIERRPYAAGDATAYRLVVTATGIPAVDGAVFADAEAAGVWVNSADDSAHCSFILPSVHRDGAVTIAVSTAGQSPALASWLRAQLGAQYGTELGPLAELLGRARQRMHDAGRSTELVDWAALLDGPLPGLAREGRWDEAKALVEAATGTDLAL